MPPKTLTGSILLATLVIGCATIEQLAPPVDGVMLSVVEFDDKSLARLQDGRDIYIIRCARCHAPESVTAYTRQQWRSILPRMAEKSQLSAEERLAVEEYIMAVLTAHERPPATRGEA